MRYKVYGYREQQIEAVVEADSANEAEELVFVAQADGSRPDGLVEFWQDDAEWEFSTAGGTASTP